MKSAGEAWAVKIRVRSEWAWLNTGGGYSPDRYNRRLWGERREAIEDSAKWRMSSPRLVRVRFKVKGPE